ncbi:MAG: carboxylating nicotinate-nucleotide diphosphorylase [Rickettsiaceae bacterium]
MQLKMHVLQKLLDESFNEDYGIKGDITSDALISGNKQIEFTINSRQDLTICGIQVAQYYLGKYSSVKYKANFKDSDKVKKGEPIIAGYGDAKEILLIERVILNYMQHLSGIATITNLYVEQVAGTKAKICDTRKTTPMLRRLQKYAVLCGGGYNHRLALDSSILIKDNHIAICGGVTEAIRQAKKYNPHYAKIEIECDTIKQVAESIAEGVDIIMLDNMSVEEIKEALNIINGRAIVEASGNISLETVRNIANTGVDIISVGKITHSAQAVDIGLDIS